MSEEKGFSEQEQQFFAQGEALADTEPAAVEDFSDLDEHAASDDRPGNWVKRALEVLSHVKPGR